MLIKLFIGTKVAPEHLTLRLDGSPANDWRWAPREQWHVTALFIGHRPEEELEMILESITRVAERTSRFTLQQGELKAMPEERPTMLWIRFAVSPELSALHSALAAAIGIAPSPYSPYWPHITLARGKGLSHSVFQVPVIQSLAIEELTLFRSDPTPGGTVHTPLMSWPLA